MNQRFSQLAEILVALSGNPIPSQQFQTLADYAGFVLDYDYLAIALVEPSAQGYLIHSLVGSVAGAIRPRMFGLDEGMVGQVLTRKKTFVTADITNESVPQTADFEGMCARFGLRSALAAPIRQGSEPIGALVFMAKAVDAYAEGDVQVGTLLAAGLSASLETARMYQAVADERSTLAAVLGSTRDAVLVVNEQGVVLLANPAAQQMLGVDVVTLTGRPLSNIHNSTIEALFANVEEGQQEVKLADGRFAEVNLLPVNSEYGEPIGWAAVFHDISLYKELEQMKNDFVNIVSHDLKNPISTINLAIDLMKRMGPLSEKQLEMRDRIKATTEYMTELISDLLDLGKIETGLEQEMMPFDLVALTNDVWLALQTGAEAKQQEVALTLPTAVEVVGDVKRLRQVLLNLIGNAIKYTPERGRVAVQIQTRPDRVTVTVKDNGLGIPAADLPYIFDKFYRVSAESTKGIKGTGLGLAIVKSVVEAHNGRIWADSTLGQGSTFTFTLPITALK
jgi:two-component system NtrC family sensor kinase